MKKARNYLLAITTMIMLILCIGPVSTKAETTDKWYEEYKYILFDSDIVADGHARIVIQEYLGKDTEIYVPAYAKIDGTTYQTCMQGDEIWKGVKKTVRKIEFEKGCRVLSGAGLFNELEKLESVNVENLDWSENTSLTMTFSGCKSLTSLNVADMDTSQVTSLFSTFDGCIKLRKLDVSKWDTSKVTTMSSTFSCCQSLRTLNVENWDVSQVNSICLMFNGCASLDSLDLHKWDTKNITDMGYAFLRCDHLRRVNIKGWNTPKVTRVAGLFTCCYSLESIDLSSLDLSNIRIKKDDNSMLLRCYSLKTIKTPKKLKKNHPIETSLIFRKKGSLKKYNYMPKGTKSVTLICASPKGKSVSITSVKKSKNKVQIKWSRPANADSAALNGLDPQYEVQISDSKDFAGQCGVVKNCLDDGKTYSIEGNVVDKTTATITNLEKGKTYYVRIRVSYYDQMISDWSKVKKFKY